MKRLIVLLLIASGQFPMVNYVCAENYGITISGTEITDANCNNVTNGYVGAYDKTKPHSIKYDPGSKTLTLQNIKIERAGKDNRAIRNYGCDGLTIVFDGLCYLYAIHAAPVRLEKNTTITTTNVVKGDDVIIKGCQEDGIYITKGSKLTFYKAALYVAVELNCSCIEGDTGKEELIISGSALNIDIPEEASEAYSLHDIGSIFVENSFVYFPNSVKNVDYVTTDTNAYYKPRKNKAGEYGDVEFSDGKFVFADNHSEAPENVAISTGVPIDETYFPDANFRNYLCQQSYGKDRFIACNYPMELQDLVDETDDITDINVTNKGIKSLKGIEFFQKLKSLLCAQNSIRSLDLSKLKKLEKVDCSGNKIDKSAMTSLINYLPEVSSKSLTIVDHSYAEEQNEFNANHAALAKERGWIAKHKDSSGTLATTNGCEKIDLWLGGNRLLNCMNTDTDGNGYRYDSKTKTLYLTAGAKISGTVNDADHDYGSAIHCFFDGLTIYVDGVINAYAADNQKCVGVTLNKTTIKGTGQLYCNGKVGMQINNDVTIEGDVTVQAMGTSCGIISYEPYYKTLTVKGNAKLNAYISRTSSPYSAIFGLKSLQLQNRHCITAPVGAYWYFNEDEEVSYVVNSDGKKIVGDLVMIAPAQKADVNLDGNINTADVVAIYSFIENGDTSGVTREDVDVNSDSLLNTADVVKVYDAIINGSEEE